MDTLDTLLAQATLGLDTLWGGDVQCPSGMGRFIADSWFSGEPLPSAYTHPTAARLRETGGVGAKQPDVAAIRAYVDAVDLRAVLTALAQAARPVQGLRGAYLAGMVECLDVMWDLAMEMINLGDKVPYARCVQASTGRAPRPSDGRAQRARLAELLGTSDGPGLLTAVDAWRAERRVPNKSIPALAGAFIAQLDALSVRNVMPHLPGALHAVPRANVHFLPIENAWFSGSMNYLGRARRPDGTPEYEASYEINAALQISVPEFQQLVSHEVVPGHVTTFAYLQNLWERRQVGFEATVPAMNTRAATLSEGIANNAILMAHGVTELHQLPDRDLETGTLLALLQDEAKNQSSYLTWQEGRPQAEVAPVLRQEFLVSPERADKLSGAWGRHPLLGRMYLPCYKAGTETVAELRRRYGPDRVLPAVFSCGGLVDVVTVVQLLDGTLAA